MNIMDFQNIYCFRKVHIPCKDVIIMPTVLYFINHFCMKCEMKNALHGFSEL